MEEIKKSAPKLYLSTVLEEIALCYFSIAGYFKVLTLKILITTADLD